jgi:hypothetical protein
LKFWRFLVVLAAAMALPALAQDDSAPSPAPLPAFQSPVASGEDGAVPPANDSTQPAPASADDAGAAPASPPPATAKATAKAATTVPQPVLLTASITDGGQPIGGGLVWRVFGTKPDHSGQLPLEARSTDAAAQLSLAPGDYVVDVAYGHAQASDTLSVKEGKNDMAMVLNAGALRLNASVSGDVPIPINLLHFDIFTSGASDADRAVVAQNLGANDIITLNAGTYHVVSYFGDVNAIVRADLKVEPGQLTDATLYHKAAQVSFKLVSETGGEAIADVDWTVKTADGTTVFTNTGTFPSTVLEAGDYLILGKRGDKVYNRNFEVQAGQPKEIEVLTTVY